MSAVVLCVSGVVCFYYVYRYVWFHAIDLFETYQSQVTSRRPSVVQTESSFVKVLKYDLNLKDIQWVKTIARIVFTVTITTVVVIMEFILIQLLNAHGDTPSEIDSISLFIWQTSIITILANLILVQPLIITVLLINKLFKNELLNKFNIKLISSTLIMIVWLLFVSKFDTLTDFNDGTFFIGLDTWKSIFFHKISIIGITLIAILNGIGSYSTFYYYLYQDFKSQPIDKDTKKQRLSNLNKTFYQTESLIDLKLKELDQRNDNLLQKRPNIQPKGSFLDLEILERLNNKKNEKDELSNEINSLTKIKNDVSYKISKIENSLDATTYMESNSSYFKSQQLIKNIIQKAIAIYCVFKMIQVTIITIISFYQAYHKQDRTSVKESDPLVITISKIIQLFITINNEEFLVNFLSFLVSGGLFICSFNGVFLSLRHLYKFIPIDLSQLENPNSSLKHKPVSIIKNLIISELLGIYGLATLLILKSSLTNNFRSTLMSLLSRNTLNSSSIINNEDIHIIDFWFDKVYLVSMLITISAIRLSEIFGNDYDGYESQELLDKIV